MAKRHYVCLSSNGIIGTASRTRNRDSSMVIQDTGNLTFRNGPAATRTRYRHNMYNYV